MQNKQERRVLAIDPGFDRMGVAILAGDKGEEKVLFSTCISTNPKETRGQRILQIGTELGEIILSWGPTALAIETLFFNQNAPSAMGVAEARGVAIYECGRAGLSVHEYSPQEVKIAVTGYGRAAKKDVLSMVGKLVKFHKEKCLDDEIDAIAIGLTHMAIHTGPRV